MPSDNVIESIIAIVPSLATLILVYMQGQKLEIVHSLVNSNLGVALKLNAANSKWRADMSGKSEDLQASDQASALLAQHEDNQAKADAKS